MKNVRVRTKIAFSTVLVGLVALVTIGLVGIRTGSDALEKASFEKLKAVREMKASQIERYFEQIRSQVVTLSQNGMVVEAMRGFRDTLRSLEDPDPADQEYVALGDRLREYYSSEFLPRYNRNVEDRRDLEAFWPAGSRSRALQGLYIADNSNEVGQKQRLDDAGDGSEYSRLHARFHPIMRSYLERFGYYDIFLIDAETGFIVYSVFKEVDFATSLKEGPYRDTALARSFRAAAEAREVGFARLEDYAPYPPSYNAHASFVAASILDGEDCIGVLAFQMPVEKIDSIMTSNQGWERVGLGRSGETYIVGSDSALRNQSRFFIEAREDYLRTMESNGLPRGIVEKMRNLGTVIGLQEVRTPGAEAALRGETGEQIFPDYRGVRVLSAYRPLDIPDVRWGILSEIDESEAFAGVERFRVGLVVSGLALLAFFGLVAFVLSGTLTRPLRALTTNAEEMERGNLGVEIQVVGDDEIGTLGKALSAMRSSVQELLKEREQVNRELERRVSERTAELEGEKQRVEAILEVAPDAIVTIGDDQQIIGFNPGAERIFGYRADEILNKPVHDLLPASYREGHVELVGSFQESDTRTVLADDRKEVVGRRKDGSEFPAELGITKWQVDGKVYCSGFVRDLTEEHEAKARLQLQSAALKAVANGVVITTPGGLIEWVNPAFSELTGYGFEEAIGLSPRVFKSGEHDDAFYAELWSTILAGEVWRGELTNKRKDGTLYFEEMAITPVSDEAGEILHFVAVKQDVTERKRIESELNEAFEVIKKQNQRMENELTVAREIQMGMLPLIFPAFPDRKEFEIHALLRPAREVGGDFYDFFFIDDRRFCFCIGDVSDKGVPAALFMAVTKTLIKSRALDDISPASILTHVNDELGRENDSCMFVTVFLCILDLDNHELKYSNAGHNPPYILRADGSLVRLDTRHGPVVAATEGMTYGEDTLTLSPLDTILLYTDGVTEAMNRERELYGEERLTSVFRSCANDSAETVTNVVLRSVQEFEGGAEQSDDVTVVAMKILEAIRESEEIPPLKLEVESRLEEIDRVNSEVSSYVTQLGIDEKTRRQLNIVIDELLNNVISYAFEDQDVHLIEFSVSKIGKRLVICISDDGVPFNAFAREDPDTDLAIEDRPEGGLGIHLVRNLMDEVSYQRAIGRNNITLVKLLEE